MKLLHYLIDLVGEVGEDILNVFNTHSIHFYDNKGLQKIREPRGTKQSVYS